MLTKPPYCKLISLRHGNPFMEVDDNNSDFADLSPDTIIDAIESQQYLCDRRLLALNSYENRVYRVGIEDDLPVIAKFYRPNRWTAESINEEHAFAAELAAVDIPIVCPLPDAAGNTLREYGRFQFALYPMRGGRSPELDNPDQLEIIGRFIAQIHMVGEQKQFRHRPAISSARLATEPAEWLLENDRLPSGLTQPYEQLISDLKPKIDRLLQDHPVPQIRLHGDFHPGNILWRDETPHIVDLDDARTGPAIQDLWLFLSGDRAYQQARLVDLLEGYTMFRTFNPTEISLIEALRTLRIIHYASWLDQRRDEPAFRQAFPWIGSNRFWDDHILLLKEQSAALDEPPLQLPMYR